MWDAAVDEHGARQNEVNLATTVTTRAAATGFRVPSGAGPRVDRTLSKASGIRLRLSPDRAWLNDASRRFPITLDPSVSTYYSGADTYVVEGSSTDHSTASDLQVGWVNGARHRALIKWTVPWAAGSHVYVSSASANLYNFWSGACARAYWEIWRLTGSWGVTWATMPTWTQLEGSSNQTKGYSTTCADGGDGYVSVDAKSFFQHASDNNVTTAYMGVKAQAETDGNAFKQFRPHGYSPSTMQPYVNVTWYPLSTVTSATMTPAAPSGACTTGSGRPWVKSATPTISATISNPAGGSMYGRFEMQTLNGATTVVPTVTTGQVTSGSTVSYTIPSGKLTSGQSYRWHAAGDDNHMWSGNGLMPQVWSSWCEFSVDTVAPSSLTVTSSSHPTASGWYNTSTFNATLGATEAGAIGGYAVKIDTSSSTSPGTTVTQTSNTVSATGQADGNHWLHFAVVDKAGNWSSPMHRQFNVDVTKPGTATVTSTTHPVPTNWYNSRTLTASWSPPSDLSGIGQYAIKVDQAATTLPATTDGLQTGTSITTTVGADGVWYLHVRAKDSAGNWSDSAAHFKFQVDTTLPPAPTIASSTHPDQSKAYPSGVFSASWTPPSGGASGYGVVLDTNPTTTPGTTVTTTETTYSTTVGEGTWYLHVRAKDLAGNWGGTAHFRFIVDVTAPDVPLVSSDDFPTGEWADKLNTAGVITLDPGSSSDVVTFRYSLDGGTSVDAVTDPGQPLNVEVIPTTDGPHTLTVWALDIAGNISGSAEYTFLIGAGAGTLDSPDIGDITAAKAVLSATGHSSTTGVTFQWRRAETDVWQTIPAADVTFTSGGGAVTWPVAKTGGTYPRLTWNVASTINSAEVGPEPLDGPME